MAVCGAGRRGQGNVRPRRSSAIAGRSRGPRHAGRRARSARRQPDPRVDRGGVASQFPSAPTLRSEEHTSELQSLMRISYAVFCLKKKKQKKETKQKHKSI